MVAKLAVAVAHPVLLLEELTVDVEEAQAVTVTVPLKVAETDTVEVSDDVWLLLKEAEGVEQGVPDFDTAKEFVTVPDGE